MTSNKKRADPPIKYTVMCQSTGGQTLFTRILKQFAWHKLFADVML
ncbi:hypothetical protein [Halalkalibacter flavus]